MGFVRIFENALVGLASFDSRPLAALLSELYARFDGSAKSLTSVSLGKVAGRLARLGLCSFLDMDFREFIFHALG
jgi:hypothetical protein